MKKDLHPKYQKATIECACGNKMETRSTQGPVIKVELCSACHPFFTGKQKFVDTAGRVDKFRARMEAKSKLNEKSNVKNEKDKEGTSKELKNNQETLKDIKAQITEKLEAPVKSDALESIEVTQEVSSDTETAAAEELEIAKEKESVENKDNQ